MAYTPPGARPSEVCLHSRQLHTNKNQPDSQPNTVDTLYGPPVAPQRGRGKCPHARPKRKRNRPCRQCGYYSIEQCCLGGIRSGIIRRWNTRKRDSRARNLRYKRGLTGAAIAAAVGVCVRTVWYILNRQPFRKLPKHVQAHGLIECATNILHHTGQGAWGPFPTITTGPRPRYQRKCRDCGRVGLHLRCSCGGRCVAL